MAGGISLHPVTFTFCASLHSVSVAFNTCNVLKLMSSGHAYFLKFTDTFTTLDFMYIYPAGYTVSARLLGVCCWSQNEMQSALFLQCFLHRNCTGNGDNPLALPTGLHTTLSQIKIQNRTVKSRTDERRKGI
jgi:hypothetical protein